MSNKQLPPDLVEKMKDFANPFNSDGRFYIEELNDRAEQCAQIAVDLCEGREKGID